MKFRYTFYLLLLVSTVHCLSVSAQRSRGITVEGTVSVENGSPEGAVVQMFRDGRRMDDYGIGASGHYKLELPYNHKYELIFKHEGHFQQKLVVEADVPKKVLATDPFFPPFPVDINLFAEIPGIDKSFSANTILKIYYDPNVDNFIAERYYNDAQIKHLIEQAVLQGKQVDKRADYLDKLTRAELAELRKEYNKFLEEAAKQYSNEQFLAALDGYKAASEIFPNEQFPKDRIAEINDLLGLMMAEADLNKARLARFKELVEQGDLLFEQKKLAEAKNVYSRALSIQPQDEHVLEQLAKIKEVQRQQMVNQQYLDLVEKGDNALDEMMYSKALELFEQARELKPNEKYPQNRIAKINNLLAQQNERLEKEKNYKEAMFEGEKQFSKQFYDRALAAFQKALEYKPGDAEAQKRIAETQQIVQEILNKMTFDKLMTEGDIAYKEKNFALALSNYEQALALFQDNKKLQKRVEEIKQIIYLENNFNEFVAQADVAFDDGKYDEAASLYQRALALKPENESVQKRLSEIDEIKNQQQKDASFVALLKEADELMAQESWEAAQQKYRAALELKPEAQKPKEKIKAIDRILAELAAAHKAYDAAIARADKAFKAENWDDARTAYTEAKQAKPEESYPDAQLAKIDSIVSTRERLAREAAEAEAARLAALQAEKDKQYATAIAEADRLFDEKQYEQSRTAYQNALKVKPEESYPQQRIDEIATILEQLATAQKAYDAAIARADKAFNAENWDDARTAYTEAKQAKPEESYPAAQLAKIDSIVSTRERLAREAAEAEAARLAALQAEKDQQYATAIAEADRLFDEKQYEQSRTAYQNALKVKPEENYPQQRIDEIVTILKQLAAAQKAYDAAIARADKAFKAESWDDARTAYSEAKQAKPEESYPDAQLAKIDSIVSTRERLAREAAEAEAARLAALQAEKDQQYATAIAEADRLFDEKQYEQARTAYQNALKVKPEENYPQQRIDEITTILEQLAAAQKAYDAAIARADKAFKAESWDDARTAYTEAKQAQPAESYPDAQLAKIDSIVSTRERLAREAAEAEAARLAALQAEKDQQYATAIAEADRLFDEKQYEQSRTAYQNALKVKPEENYPQQRIDEIATILEQLAQQKAQEERINREYSVLIQQADRLLASKNLAQAGEKYRAALDLKPDESYPAEKLAEIEKLVRQNELNEQYRQVILAADAQFKTQQYSEALAGYQQAMELKPDESYPKEQLAKIEEIFARQKAQEEKEKADAAALAKRREALAKLNEELDEQRILEESGVNALYEEILLRADAHFENKQYNLARAWYYKALELKENESYPKDQILKINEILAGLMLSQRDKEYQRFIDLGDENLRKNELAVARGWYNQALSQKPNEEYPKQQLAEIQKRIEERLAGKSEAQVEKYRTAAKEAMQKGDALVARFYWRKVLSLRPSDSEAKEALQAINSQN